MSKEWGQDAIKDVELTKEEIEKLYNAVIEDGRGRKGFVRNMSEPDYLCGAMSVFNALNIACPTWPVSIMIGKSVLNLSDES